MGIKNLLKILLIVLIFGISNLQANATIVRVGINNQGAFDYKTVSLFSTGGMKVYNSRTEEEILSVKAEDKVEVKFDGEEFTLNADGKFLDVKLTDNVKFVTTPTGLIGVTNSKRAGKQAYYRGSFELTKATKNKNKFYLVNVIDVEEYLKGVVPNEMPVYFGLSALKAQAIAARNYVLTPRTKAYAEFDVGDTVASQVYYGANTEKELSNRAISETEGLVALYNWKPILALYCSTAGGYSESYGNAFVDPNNKNFGADKPYLQGVPDNPNQDPLRTQNDVKDFYTSKPQDAYDIKSPYYRWQREWTKEELEQVLITNIKKQKGTYVIPENKNLLDLKDLKDIQVRKHGVSGKIIEMDIVFDNNTVKVYKELVIRRLITKDGKALPSANVYFDLITERGELVKIVAYGGGYGHGVGLSQWGAGYMSTELKKPYSAILKHYYSNIAITTPPVIISNYDAQLKAVQKFYTSERKARVVIDNKYQLTKIPAKINNTDILILLEKHVFPTHKYDSVDISKYLKKGENTVEFTYPMDEGKKAARLYVELTGENE